MNWENIINGLKWADWQHDAVPDDNLVALSAWADYLEERGESPAGLRYCVRRRATPWRFDDAWVWYNPVDVDLPDSNSVAGELVELMRDEVGMTSFRNFSPDYPSPYRAYLSLMKAYNENSKHPSL